MILLTGATGYIGSHIWAALLKNGISVVGLDNLSNSSEKVLDEIERITQRSATFVKGDIRDSKLLNELFFTYPITHVIHLAALKDVHESMNRRAEYFDVNVKGLEVLLQAMRSHGCFKLVFSSSAAVYGLNASSPISESSNLAPINYYGETKMIGEYFLANEFSKSPPISTVILRYFNVAGKGLSEPILHDIANRSQSLFSEIYKVLHQKKKFLNVFGGDWETKDGTCIRDYLHVEDVAQGHIEAIQLLDKSKGFYVLNLGLGIGQSVYEIITTCEMLAKKNIPIKIISKRSGDVGVSFANIELAKKLINWQPKMMLIDICRDSIR